MQKKDENIVIGEIRAVLRQFQEGYPVEILLHWMLSLNCFHTMQV